MASISNKNDLSKLYAPEPSGAEGENGPADQALLHLWGAWRALESLESGLPGDLSRWDAESLTTARKGARRAWLALSNLNRSLGRRRYSDDKGRKSL